MLFFFNINPKILSQLAQVLFDPAAFLLVINMRDCNLTNQDRQREETLTPVLLCNLYSPRQAGNYNIICSGLLLRCPDSGSVIT